MARGSDSIGRGLVDVLKAGIKAVKAKSTKPGAAATPKPEAKGRVTVKERKRRKPAHRCELVPFDELECPTGSARHHVVPDWMLRMNKRGEAGRIPDMPSLEKGPAICMEGGKDKEHHTSHKHTDQVAERVARKGKATGTAGTLKLGQAKVISARAIEKATGGKKGGGCAREDIKKQLDEKFKAPDDALLRGVKDSKKVTQAIKDAASNGNNSGGI